jgi:hypothetical protein
MQQGSVVACQRCGSIYAISANACPQCGAPTASGSTLGQFHDVGVASIRPRPQLQKRKPWAVVVLVGGSAAVAIAASVLWAATHDSEPPAAPAPVVQPSAAPAPVEKKRAIDADLMLDKARAEALGWDSDAVLSSLVVGPFVGGKLVAEGTLKADYGKPAGAHVGPGAGLHNEHLILTVTRDGAVESEKQSAKGGVGLPDPNCIMQEVWRKVLPDSLDASARFNLIYEQSRRDARAVYRITKEDSDESLRVLDGVNCSFLLH